MAVFSFLYSSAMAGEFKPFPDNSFVDTRFFMRQAGQDLPDPMPMAAFVIAPALMPSRTELPVEAQPTLPSGGLARELVLAGGFESNGSVLTQAALAHQGFGPAEIWGGARRDRVLPYQDGAGHRANYSYDRLNSQAALGYQASESSHIFLFGLDDHFADSRLPAYGVDTPSFRRRIGAGTLDHKLVDGPFDRFEAGGNITVITYRSDNETLRSPHVLGISQGATWTYYRGLVRGEFSSGRFRNTVTFDGNLQNYQATITNSLLDQGVSSYRLPDVMIARTGITLATVADTIAGGTLSGGLRTDMVRSWAGWARRVGQNAATAPPSRP